MAWSLAEYHLQRVTTESLLWEPSTSCWTVHRDSEGTWRPDWMVPEPDPTPPPTAAWVSWHLGWWWTEALAQLTGQAPPGREDITWPGDAAATVTWLRALHDAWVAQLDALKEADLDAPVTFPWPREADRSVADLLAWVNVELTKNTAEIGQLTMIFTARQ
ncbi:DinB family protein [Quadrisphaera granulorum]|uniref:DinB family protein n=1 Tax=Quadrisphaera granulorum TaxID=317664 RepID=UPI001FE77F46|nr:DinB family protein [Quadrisphaera granulorum]